ncbi:hypothetical protein [Jiangella rhizosphaerae]|nr:hypothetical protein [Jiangella rhizosphaerae]
MAGKRSRTTNFEDSYDPDVDLADVLGRRTAEPATQAAPPADTPADTADTADAPASQPPPAPQQPSPRPRRPRSTTPAAAAAPRSDEKKRKPSVVYVSQDNVTKIKHLRDERAWSSGMVILQAINDTYSSGKLKERLGGRTMTSDLFGDFTSRVASTSELNKMPLNVRLNPDHYSVIDRLVDELGADSRSHLINTALDEYFKAEDVS